MRRHFHFKLRVLFILPALVGAWLLWQFRTLEERHTQKIFLEQHGGMVIEDDNQDVRSAYLNAFALNPELERKSMRISWIRRAIGDRAAVEVSFPDSLSLSEKTRIRAAFPEAHVCEIIDEDE